MNKIYFASNCKTLRAQKGMAAILLGTANQKV